YAGPTTVSAGALRLSSPTALSPNSNLSLAGGLLELSGALARPLGTAAGQLQLPSGSSGFTATVGDATITLSSPVTWGSPTLNPHLHAPPPLRPAPTHALGTGPVNLGNSGHAITSRLELTGNISLPNAITLTGRTNNSPAIENLSGNNTLSGTLTLSTGGSV